MLSNQLFNKLSFNYPILLWLLQHDPKTSHHDESQQVDEVRLKMQVLGRRKRLRRMQRQNFIVRTAYCVAELFHIIDQNQKDS